MSEQEKSREAYIRNSLAVMDKWGNGEVFDKNVVIDRAKRCQQAMTGQMLEFGRDLIILKEHLAHGEFTETIEKEFSISRFTANKFMQATLKFCGEGLQDTTPKLVQLGKSKLLELVTQDDDDLKELAEGGTVAGLKLDEVDRMSVQELRKALRNARADKDALSKVMANKDSRLNELSKELEKKRHYIDTLTPDSKGGLLRKETSQLVYGAEAILRGQVWKAFETLDTHTQESGIDHKQFMVGTLAEIELVINQLRSQFDLPDSTDAEELEPWLRADYDEEATLAKVQANLKD